MEVRNEVVVTFHKDKLRYYDPNKCQWINLTEIPKKVRGRKKVCSVKDKIYIIGGPAIENNRTHLAEYNTRTDSWRLLPNASFKPYYNDFNDIDYVIVGFFCSVGNKLYMGCSYYDGWDGQWDDGYCGIQVFDLDDE